MKADDKLKTAITTMDTASKALVDSRAAVEAAEVAVAKSEEELKRVIAALGKQGAPIVDTAGKRWLLLTAEGELKVERFSGLVV